MKRLFAISAALGLLTGCDPLQERLGIPNPEKLLAEGKAIGGACRHAGRGLEDCYRLNPEAAKPAVYEGWKEMNEYMVKNNMQAVPPEVPPKGFILSKRKKAPEENAGAEADHADGEDAAKAEGSAPKAH